MSACLPKNEDFIRAVKNVAEKFTWSDDVVCHYDASFYNNRDYVLQFTVDGTSVPAGLRAELKKLGAVGIIGKVRKAIARNYVDLAFDLKVSDVSFKDYSDLFYCLGGSNIFRPSQYEALCNLHTWFERKVKISIGEKNVTYTEIIKTLLPKEINDGFAKMIIEAETK